MLPVALFVGLATFTRLDEVNIEDALWVAAMNRIRHAYLEISPRLEPYFITGSTDDPVGVREDASGSTGPATRRPLAS